MTDPFDDAEHQAIVDDLIGRNQQILHNEDIVVNTSVGTRVMIGSTMLYGDTGWRNIPINPAHVVSGDLNIRRVNKTVTIWLRNIVLVPGSGYANILTGPYSVPQGFETLPQERTMGYVGMQNNAVLGQRIGAYDNNVSWVGDLTSQGGVRPSIGLQGSFSWVTDTAWPTSLPGTPAA